MPTPDENKKGGTGPRYDWKALGRGPRFSLSPDLAAVNDFRDLLRLRDLDDRRYSEKLDNIFAHYPQLGELLCITKCLSGSTREGRPHLERLAEHRAPISARVAANLAKVWQGSDRALALRVVEEGDPEIAKKTATELSSDTHTEVRQIIDRIGVHPKIHISKSEIFSNNDKLGELILRSIRIYQDELLIDLGSKTAAILNEDISYTREERLRELHRPPHIYPTFPPYLSPAVKALESIIIDDKSFLANEANPVKTSNKPKLAPYLGITESSKRTGICYRTPQDLVATVSWFVKDPEPFALIAISILNKVNLIVKGIDPALAFALGVSPKSTEPIQPTSELLMRVIKTVLPEAEREIYKSTIVPSIKEYSNKHDPDSRKAMANSTLTWSLFPKQQTTFLLQCALEFGDTPKFQFKQSLRARFPLLYRSVEEVGLFEPDSTV